MTKLIEELLSLANVCHLYAKAAIDPDIRRLWIAREDTARKAIRELR